MAQLLSIKAPNTEVAPLNLHQNKDEIECKINESGGACKTSPLPSKRSSCWKKFFSSRPRFHRRSGSYDVNPKPGKIGTSHETSVSESSAGVPNKRSSWKKKISSSLPRFHRSSGTYYVNPPPPKKMCAPIEQPLSIGMQLLLCYCPCILVFTYIES